MLSSFRNIGTKTSSTSAQKWSKTNKTRIWPKRGSEYYRVCLGECLRKSCDPQQSGHPRVSAWLPSWRRRPLCCEEDSASPCEPKQTKYFWQQQKLSRFTDLKLTSNILRDDQLLRKICVGQGITDYLILSYTYLTISPFSMKLSMYSRWPSERTSLFHLSCFKRRDLRV